MLSAMYSMNCGVRGAAVHGSSEVGGFPGRLGCVSVSVQWGCGNPPPRKISFFFFTSFDTATMQISHVVAAQVYLVKCWLTPDPN